MSEDNPNHTEETMTTTADRATMEETALIEYWLKKRNLTKRQFNYSRIFGVFGFCSFILVMFYMTLSGVYLINQSMSGWGFNPSFTKHVGPLIAVFAFGLIYRHTAHGRYVAEKHRLLSVMREALGPNQELPMTPAGIRDVADRIIGDLSSDHDYTDDDGLYNLFYGFCDLGRISYDG